MSKASKKKPGGNTIALNKKARHDYFLEERIEAGLALTGWEVKALRAAKGQIADAFVWFKDNEAWLAGAQIHPLPEACTHYVTDPNRMRKLLLKRRELDKLMAAVEQKGHTVVATALYWKNHIVKCEIALAKGKQLHDKRETEKARDWDVQKRRILREQNK